MARFRKVEMVGVLNATYDSFSGDGLADDIDAALQKAEDHFQNGALMVDVGGESTRPGATPIPWEEEWRRIGPILQALIPGRPDQISVDTYHPEIVRKVAAEIGTFTINDVTGMNNPEMREAAAEIRLPVIVSHLPIAHGQDIQAAHKSPELVNSLQQVVEELLQRETELVDAGVEPGMITLDPGIGFGKTALLNWRLLELARYRDFKGKKLMIGHSNKRFLATSRETGKRFPDFDNLRNNGTWLRARNLFAARLAIAASVHSEVTYLRVHDVKAHVDLLKAA